MAGSAGNYQAAWSSPTSPSNNARPYGAMPQSEASFLHSRPFSDSVRAPGNAPGLSEYGTRAERSQSLASAQASPVTPNSASAMSSASRIASHESQQDYWSRRHSDKAENLAEGRSVSLAVPYANTAPSTRPMLGDRPLQASTMVDGVLKHNRTSTPNMDSQNQKSGKRALNLLNPRNLLLRRRSQVPQAVASDANSAKSLKVPPMTLPDNYDPRIRGNVVHDFSAPRPRRESSYQNAQPSTHQDTADHLEFVQGPANASESSFQRPHSSGNVNLKRASEQSVFREQFDDDANDKERSSAIQAEALANQDFLKRFSQQSQGYDQATLPPFSRNSQQQLDFQQFRKSIGDWQTRLSDPSSIASKSEISALSNVPTDHRNSNFSQVSPESNAKDRSSQALTNPDSIRLSQASSAGPQQRSSHTTVQSQDLDKPNENGLPKHFKSNASRFSFQLGGNDSAMEERILEERAKDQRGSDAKKEIVEDDDEDSFDEDAMYDHDELEGLDDDSSLVGGLGQQDMTAFASALPVGNGYPISPDGGLPVISTPGGAFTMQPNSNIQQYLQYQRAQAALAQQGQQTPQAQAEAEAPGNEDAAYELDSEKRSDSHQGFPQEFLSAPQKLQNEYRRSRASHDFDDDLYFNDGSVEPLGYEQDSSIHDDQDVDEDILFGSDYEDELNAKHGHRTKPGLKISTSEDTASKEAQDPDLTRLGTLSPPPTKTTTSPISDGLAAYHSALADAAQKAAANGRFSRAASSATSASKYSQRSGGSQLSTRSKRNDISRHPSHNGPKPPNGARDSYSGFDFGFNDPTTSSSGNTPLSATFPINALTTAEDPTFTTSITEEPLTAALSPDPYTTSFDDENLSDDDIISEANADALASDEEGFYGREFGFYARPRPGPDASEAELVNGGYFGAPGGSNLERKYSLKEPNLTPITERSEFSTRNSLIGGPFSPAVASPAFAAQLARLSPLALAQLQEDDMGVSMEQMLKLRGLAFGGTEGTGRSGSVSSMSSAGAAPWLSGRGSWTVAGTGGQFAHGFGQGQRGSGSAVGMPQWGVGTDSGRSSVRMSRSQSEVYEGQREAMAGSPVADSPVSTQSARGLGWGLGGGERDMDVTPKKGEGRAQSPQTAVKDRSRGTGHKRVGSGADSVTYTKERDDEGKERWVLERRRTSEAGLIELVGREIVEGGRI
ncbi:hypothetical protein C1H76_7364 [Elsinoe australis]|uniref:Uncharacterized protein n=1 Tax=Elsinoe australis TaxID=40998 RepID=A0A4U7AQS3_9PEZI|nr:hypothetical protein C1H76_7364 [Elsinoe australis]